MKVTDAYVIRITKEAITNILVLNGREYKEQWVRRPEALALIGDSIAEKLHREELFEQSKLEELREAIASEEVENIFDAFKNLN